MTSQPEVDHAFTLALPKCELHAHLSGSIKKGCLHELWVRKQNQGLCVDLEDPLTAIKPGDDFVDVTSFFPLFDKYIYRLCDGLEEVRFATRTVLEDFAQDGVRYLELRTTPRESKSTGMRREDYVAAVLEAAAAWNAGHTGRMEVFLILSVDRKMTREEAASVIELAIKHSHHQVDGSEPGLVVGVDLCGNPARGDPSLFTSLFRNARLHGLGITVHFAEIPQSSTDAELETLLAWYPSRLGHAINVPPRLQKIIEERKIALELCLSCNVLAKLTTGGFSQHHFGQWHRSSCAVALGTDDVGVFGSSLSAEYLHAARHFGLSGLDLIDLTRQAAGAAFAGRERMIDLIDVFERETMA